MNSNDIFILFGIICSIRASHRRVSISVYGKILLRLVSVFVTSTPIGRPYCHCMKHGPLTNDKNGQFGWKPPASAHGPQIVSVLICIESTLVLHFRVVPKIQRHTAKPIPLLIPHTNIIISIFTTKRFQYATYSFLFHFAAHFIGFLLVPPSLSIVIEFKYIHFSVALSGTGIEVEAVQIPHVGSWYNVLIFIRFEKIEMDKRHGRRQRQFAVRRQQNDGTMALRWRFGFAF